MVVAERSDDQGRARLLAPATRLGACGAPAAAGAVGVTAAPDFAGSGAALRAKRASDAIARACLVMTGPDLFNERSPPKLFFGVCRFALDEVRGRLAMDFDKHDPLCCLSPRGCTLARVRARGRKNRIRYADRAAACAPGVLKIRV